jgi:hypothetical protein
MIAQSFFVGIDLGDKLNMVAVLALGSEEPETDSVENLTVQ